MALRPVWQSCAKSLSGSIALARFLRRMINCRKSKFVNTSNGTASHWASSSMHHCFHCTGPQYDHCSPPKATMGYEWVVNGGNDACPTGLGPPQCRPRGQAGARPNSCPVPLPLRATGDLAASRSQWGCNLPRLASTRLHTFLAFTFTSRLP